MNGNDKDALRSSPSAALGIGEALINRKRLLVSLLSDREAVRVICAPPLYGKTVLANQYARMAFPPGNVTWVQASEPEFLVNLDSGSIEEVLDSDDSLPGKLVVFDGISKLKGKRRTSLVTLMGKLHTKQCEVMVTTEIPRWQLMLNCRSWCWTPVKWPFLPMSCRSVSVTPATMNLFLKRVTCRQSDPYRL